MLFRKRKRPPSSVLPIGGSATSSGEPPLGYLIEYDMMLKGNVYERPDGKVRQYGVTVNGGTKLVTSGDSVDRATYEALIQAGVLQPDPDVSTGSRESESPVIGKAPTPEKPSMNQDE